MSQAARTLPVPGLRLHPPVCPRDIVMRHRLLDHLDAATHGRCTLLSAGPGYGKSVLLASWVAQQNHFSRIAWLSLDPADANAQRLVEHLVAALQEPYRSEPDGAAALLQLRPPPAGNGHVPRPQAFLEEALVPALDALDAPVVLIIDDVHHLGTSSSAVAALDVLLRWAPDTLRFVISGRYDPPLPLQRLRLTGQLTTFRQRELACTVMESRAVLAASGVRLSADDALALHDLTQGWPAALRLAALSCLEMGAAPAFLERFLPQDVALADYLTSEVLQGLSPSLRSFVLRATIDPLVCGSLVDAVRGGTDGDTLLAECERRNLFLTCVSPDHRWYAWHHMFADQMQRRLEIEDAQAARDAHIAAAHWWRGSDPRRAAEHAISGRDQALAAEIVAQSWVRLVLAGESETVQEMVSTLPADPAHAAELRLAASYAYLLQADQAKATASLENALAARAGIPPALRGRFDARAAWLRLLLADQEGLADVLAGARAVLLEMQPADMLEEDPTYALAVLAAGMAEARLQQDIPTAIKLLRVAAEAGQIQGLEVLEIIARAELCIPLIRERDLVAIEREAEALVEEAEHRGWQRFGPIAQPLGYRGWLAYFRGDLDTARRHLERAVEICPVMDWHRELILYFYARTCLAGGDAAGAEAGLLEARALAGSDAVPATAGSLLTGLAAEIAAARGDLAGALEMLERLTGPAYGMTLATQADLLRRAGRPQDALPVLDKLDDDPYPHTDVLKLVLRSLALHDLGEDGQAHVALERALAIAEPASLTGPFLAQADDMAPLLDEHVRRGTTHEPLATVITSRLSRSVEQVAAGRHERLTERELEILRYLRTSMPNAEIAKQLVVSVNTVKTHAAAIYRKLGVSGRREAVHRAEELGLFGFQAPEREVPEPVSGLRGSIGVQAR